MSTESKLWKIQYFGERWAAPFMDEESVQVDTPVGEMCKYCDTEIRTGQQGILRVFIDAGLNTHLAPVHRECDLRAAIGGINHQRGLCTCCGGTEQPDPEWATEWEASLLAFAHFMGHTRPRGVL